MPSPCDWFASELLMTLASSQRAVTTAADRIDSQAVRRCAERPGSCSREGAGQDQVRWSSGEALHSQEACLQVGLGASGGGFMLQVQSGLGSKAGCSCRLLQAGGRPLCISAASCSCWQGVGAACFPGVRAQSLHCLRQCCKVLCGGRRFPTKERMGKVAVSINQVTHGYQDRALFNNVSLEIERNERVALIGGWQQRCGLHTGADHDVWLWPVGCTWGHRKWWRSVWPLHSRGSMLTLRLSQACHSPRTPSLYHPGQLLQHESPHSSCGLLSVAVAQAGSPPAGPNGCGKSTLLRLILGEEQPIKGQASLGAHNVSPAYYQQNQAQALEPGHTVLDTVVLAAPDAQLDDVKALLGRMLFTGLTVNKKVGSAWHASRLLDEWVTALLTWFRVKSC